ncbi:TPA: hypothetical protein PXQ47_002567 [Yersinia enterocolitica]|nr:hypothetical protein [Yersinia enterocolitica]
MKELDSFTVERLEQLGASAMFFTGDEVAALARIALAAKRAEPVAYADRKAFENFQNGTATKEWMWAAPDSGLTALYTTPQLNSPEIPEGWNGTLETAAKLIDLCRTYTILGDTGSYKERTINDCELTMQEIESYLAAAPEKENG